MDDVINKEIVDEVVLLPVFGNRVRSSLIDLYFSDFYFQSNTTFLEFLTLHHH